MSFLSIPVKAVAATGNPNYQQFAFFVTPDVLRQALGHDPRDHKRKQLRTERPQLAGIYESVQRKMTKKRRDGLVPYIAKRMLIRVYGPALGVLPALMIGFTTPPVFIPDDPKQPDGSGTLQLSLSEDDERVLLDGLGRTDSVLALREGYQLEGVDYRMTDAAKLPLLLHVIAPPGGTSWTTQHLQQVFHDINCLAETVRPAVAIRGDHADLFIQITRQLAECDAIELYGGLTVGSPNPKGDDLVSQHQLLKFVRGALGGPRAAESDGYRIPQQEEILARFKQNVVAICEFLSAVAEAMGDGAWQNRKGSFHATTPGWATLGLTYWYTLRLNDDLREAGMQPIEIAQVAALVGAHVDWTRENPEWIRLGVAKVNKKGETVLAGAGRSTRAAMFAHVANEMLRKWPHTQEVARAILPGLFSEEPVSA